MEAIGCSAWPQDRPVEYGSWGEFCWVYAEHAADRSEYKGESSNARLDSDFELVGQVRLDAREELCAALGGACAHYDSLSDIELVRVALGHFEEETFYRLKGDFSFACFSAFKKALYLVRDPFGIGELYYSHGQSGRLWASNSITALLACPEIDVRVDQQAAVDFMCSGRVNFWDKSLTPYRAIRQVLPGRFIEFKAMRVAEKAYWTFPEPKDEYSRLCSHEVAELFRDELANAVRDRIRNRRVVLMLSGGLDSTSIAAVLPSVCGDAKSVCALTASSGLSDQEGILANRVSNSLGIKHYQHEVVRGAPLRGWRSSPFPVCNLFNAHLKNLEVQSGLGDFSLNACSADYMLAPGSMTASALIKRYGVFGALQVVALLYRRYGYFPKFGATVKKRAQWLIRRSTKHAGRLGRQNSTLPPGPKWLSPDMRQLIDKERGAAQIRPLLDPSARYGRLPALKVALRADSLTMRGTQWPMDFVPTRFGDPFLDERVLQLLWSLPALPWFHQKHLIRYSMVGLLPKEVVNRPKTPARQWKEQGGSDFLENWNPTETTSEFVVQSELPSRFGPDTKNIDLYPVFYDLWCRDAEIRIRQLRRPVEKK
jgi:hypothetical protein